jgi:hypothetical protein
MQDKLPPEDFDAGRSAAVERTRSRYHVLTTPAYNLVRDPAFLLYST